MQKRQSFLFVLVCVAGLGLPGVARAQGTYDTIVEWNRILQTTVVGTATPTVFYSRPYAMTAIAVFDALNSFTRTYYPYVVDIDVPTGASADAAVAQAAHDVLVALYPGSRAALDASLATTLSRLPAAAANDGARVGAAAARAILENRAADGWDRQPTPYILPATPGFYQITPPQNATVTFTHYPDVKPFVIRDHLHFLSAPPPGLTTERYATDFNEVKALGAATGSTRTAEQTSIAQRWAAIGTSTQNQHLWANVAIDLGRARGLGAVDLARALALQYIGQHDGLLVTFNGKFLYGLWRPVTAVREADNDGNPATSGDPNWLSLLPTPPYPAYPGNMTCLAAVNSRTLERVFGRDDIRFSVTWTGTGGAADISRTYNGFRELANEQARSRVYGGIHFEFDQAASFGQCIPLADYTVDNFLRRR